MQNIKVVVIGDGAVGKSCFLITWTTDSFPGEYVPTVFDNYSHNVLRNGKPVSIFLWDTAGQEDYDRLRPLSYPQTDVFLMCYDISRRSSLDNLRAKWFPEINHHCPGTPFVVLGLKADLKQNGNDFVSYEEGTALAKELGAAAFFEASSLQSYNIQQVMDGIVDIGVSSSSIQSRRSRRFNLFKRKRNNNLIEGSEIEPSIPPPPSLPPSKKAPWVHIDTSILTREWSKLLNNQEFSDVQFHLGCKNYFAHKYILVTSSDIMRQLFEIKLSRSVDSLSDKDLWSKSKIKNFSFDSINEGKEDGFLSVVFDNQPNGPSNSTNVYITLDENSFTEVAFKRCLEFLYTGYVDLNKDSLELDQTILAARLMNLPELQMICENARLEQEFLNPSIGTWLNDRNSSIAKTLFLNQQLMSDIKFRVEGEVVYGHKVVLSARCEVLGAMLTGGFAESNSAEIELPEISLETFLALLEYLYTDHSPIEDSDSIGILVLANQYGLPRLINLCELYITKQVDKACAQSIADADIDIIELLLSTQLHNAHQLSAWCLHFIASNYVAFENNEHFEILTDESKGYIETNRWPPVSYIQAMEEYKEKYGGTDDEKDEGDSSNTTVKRHKNKHDKCKIM